MEKKEILFEIYLKIISKKSYNVRWLLTNDLEILVCIEQVYKQKLK